MAVIGYIRVSTEMQDVKNQQHEILQYINDHHLHVDEFMEFEISSRKSKAERGIDKLLEKLQPGDTLIVSELSRIGRSTSEVIDIVNSLIDKKVNLVAIKQNLNITNKLDMSTKIIVTMFSLFAELERDIISERTKQALAVRKANGVILGKPKGTLQKSVLDEYSCQIVEWLKLGVSKSAIAKILKTSRVNLFNYIKSRNLEAVPKKQKNVKQT
jgi:DNA invertase Pin-like site-specific DNA recombinase